jgi:hypothetical protein
VKLSVLVPLVVATSALVLFYVWYRRKLADMKPDVDARSLPGARLTAERLRQLASPPWRVVYEINDRHLSAVDHVVVGPTGVVAIETLMLDRPEITEGSSDPQLIATAAIERGDVDDLTRAVGVPCNTLAKVYWGTAQPDRPAAIEVTTGLVAIDGHRLVEWLVGLPPGPLSTAQIDQVWQAVTIGVGRPDPLV